MLSSLFFITYSYSSMPVLPERTMLGSPMMLLSSFTIIVYSELVSFVIPVGFVPMLYIISLLLSNTISQYYFHFLRGLKQELIVFWKLGKKWRKGEGGLEVFNIWEK